MGMLLFKANFGRESIVMHLEQPKEDVQDAINLAIKITILYKNL